MEWRDGGVEGGGDNGRAGAKEENRTSRGKLRPLVGGVNTYRRADGGEIWRDGRVVGIGDPFWNLQYLEQDGQRNRVSIVRNISSQH